MLSHMNMLKFAKRKGLRRSSLSKSHETLSVSEDCNKEPPLSTSPRESFHGLLTLRRRPRKSGREVAQTHSDYLAVSHENLNNSQNHLSLQPSSLHITGSYNCLLDRSPTSDIRHPTSLSPQPSRESNYEDMALLRRSESDRRVVTGRLRPFSLQGSARANIDKSPQSVKSHTLSQSTDGLNVLWNRSKGTGHDSQGKSVRLALHKEPSIPPHSHLKNIGPAHRSLSHRELNPRMSSTSDGIVDAFGFVSAGSYSNYHSAINLHQQHQAEASRRQTEVPTSHPVNYPPADQARYDLRGYRPAAQYSKRPTNLQQQPPQQAHSYTDRHIHVDMNKENYSGYRNRDMRPQQPNPLSTYGNNLQPNAIQDGYMVNDSDNVQRRNKPPRYIDSRNGGLNISGEVVTEKGRSVKSIIGMFDNPLTDDVSGNRPHGVALNTNPVKAGEQVQPMTSSLQTQHINGTRVSKPDDRSGRQGTQVVHIAKFIQIDTPSKPAPAQYTDAQTSPIQLSPSADRSPSGADKSPSGAIIAKAETFQGTPRPKLAIMTSSSSSYLSNEVFTPSENLDTPVFDTEVYVQNSYDSGAHTQYSDANTSDSYDLAHNSYIPDYRYPQQYYAKNTQTGSKRDPSEVDSSHYEDLESLNTQSATDVENIYEPISPMQNEFTGNYMNFTTSPSNDYVKMPPVSQSKTDRRSNESEGEMISPPYSAETFSLQTKPSTSSNDSATGSVGNQNDIDSQSYSNQVRQASHRALRQTSVEGNKYRSPTREELSLNRYNSQLTNKSNANLTNYGRQQGNVQYNSDLSLNEQTSPSGVKMRNKPHRTDSYRQVSRSKAIERTHSYKESRVTSSDGRPDSTKVMIRDNLRDFMKRKSRESSADNSLDGSKTSINSSGSQYNSSNQTSHQQRPMQRIQSERAFDSRHYVTPRVNNMDRGVSHSHRHSLEIPGESSKYNTESSYMQSWEASNIANQNSLAASRNPTSPLTDNVPKVKKPLVAEVSPFSMPGSRNWRDHSSRAETNNGGSSIGSMGGSKPMKPRQQSLDDRAPTLPPRNYKLESDDGTDLNLNNHVDRSTSDASDITKPYQNVFNGNSSSSSSKLSNDDRFDADYTDKLRKLSENQYNKPVSQPTSNNKPALPRQIGKTSVVSPQSQPPTHLFRRQPPPITHKSSHIPPTPSNGGIGYNPVTSKQNSITSSVNAGNHCSPKNQVLETDIDCGATENQPVPPPRRPNKEPESHQAPPPKPPKNIALMNEINHNEHSQHITQCSVSLGETNLDNSKNVNHLLGNLDAKYPESNLLNSKKMSKSASSDTCQSPNFRDSDSNIFKPIERKERRSHSSVSSPKSSRLPSATDDMTVTSGDPTAHIIRRHSFGKKSRSHSRRASSNSNDDSPTDSKPSPVTRLHQRETEFSGKETSVNETSPIPSNRSPKSMQSAGVGEKPVPFDRYSDGPESNPTGYNQKSHSRQASAELLDIVARADSLENLRKSPLTGRRSTSSLSSPTPAPRSSSGLSPLATPTSIGGSADSPNGSRKSTPSPHSSHSDIKTHKSDSSTPIDKTFIPISTEILAELSNQGIDINGKHKCISDESKARLVKLTALNGSPPPTKSNKNPPIRHIRQKSSDEILCDHQVENIGKSIKDASISQVLSQNQKAPKDYLPGLFDDVLTKEIPRKQRTSLDGSPYHSKQNSEGDGLFHKTSKASKTDELCSDEDKKNEIIQILEKKLSVLRQDQEFLQQEIDDNDASGANVEKFVEDKCSAKEVTKYKSYIDEIEKITKLLLKLSRRLARAENELKNAPMDATDDEKKSLEQKRNNLQQQHDDAKALKESIDRRKQQVTSFLERSLEGREFKMYDDFVSIKLRLIMESSDIDDQIIHCEEQISAIHAIKS